MSLFESVWMLQPVEQPGQTSSVVLRYQTRCVYRKSFEPKAPTGQRSTTLPDSLFSSGRPGKTSISSWCPRPTTCNSAVPEISLVNRTHRVHMMQRSVNSVILLDNCGLFGGVFLLYLAWTIYRARPADQAAPVRSSSLTGAFLSTLLLTLSNPATILFFFGVVAGLGVRGSAWAIVPGFFLGSASWWIALSLAASAFGSRLNAKALRGVNLASSLVILAFALYALAGLFI